MLRHVGQHRVTRQVAVAVVHLLEVVEVDDGERAAVTALQRALQRVGHAHRGALAVQQAGQRVVLGLVLQIELATLALVDVGDRQIGVHVAVFLELHHAVAQLHPAFIVVFAESVLEGVVALSVGETLQHVVEIEEVLDGFCVLAWAGVFAKAVFEHAARPVVQRDSGPIAPCAAIGRVEKALRVHVDIPVIHRGTLEDVEQPVVVRARQFRPRIVQRIFQVADDAGGLAVRVLHDLAFYMQRQRLSRIRPYLDRASGRSAP